MINIKAEYDQVVATGDEAALATFMADNMEALLEAGIVGNLVVPTEA